VTAEATTPLVRLFLERSGCAGTSVLDTMEEHVERLRDGVGGTGRGTLESYLSARNVRSCNVVPELEAEGATRPLGLDFADGFVVEIREGLPQVRHRFTEAHELCHTFFYELVPEIKFRPHLRDPLEERLCNYGAAALLIPRRGLRDLVEERPVSLETLEELCRLHGVAYETMFMRLRDLRLWDCQLSIWHRGTAGQFMSLQTYGWPRGEWNWMHEEVLDRAWGQPGAASITGKTFVYREDSSGRSFALPIQYEVRRHGKVVAALSSGKPLGPDGGNLSLFGEPGGSSSKARPSHRPGAARGRRTPSARPVNTA